MMKITNQILRTTLCVMVLLSLLLTGCGSKKTKDTGREKAIGITMNQTMQWKSDGAKIKARLEDLGYNVDLRYTENVVKQTAAIRKFIDDKVSCIVIGAVEENALTDVLEDAKNNGIPVIAYEKLIKNTKAVNYYLGFDDKSAGIEMGRMMETKFQLETASSEGRTYTMNLVAGETDNKNDEVLYDGIMQIMDPYIDAKVMKFNGDDSVKTAKGLNVDSYTIDKIEKDYDLLADKAIKMIQNVADGYEPEVNDIENYYNGKYIVPAYVCQVKVLS